MLVERLPLSWVPIFLPAVIGRIKRYVIKQEIVLGINLSSVQPLQQEIVAAYADSIADPRTLLSVLRTNKAYQGIPLPLISTARSHGYIFDKTTSGFSGRHCLWTSASCCSWRTSSSANTLYKKIYDWCCGYMGRNFASPSAPNGLANNKG